MYLYDKSLHIPENINHKGDNFFGLRYKVSDNTESKKTITGIDSNFTDKYENIKLDGAFNKNISNSEFLNNINSSDWNGVLIPQMYLTEKNIGTKYVVEIDGRDVEFIIVGGYYTNDFSEMKYYVSNNYLQEQLNKENEFNVAYSLSKYDSNTLKIGSQGSHLSKSEIAENSKVKVIKGAEIITIIAVILIICTITMIINYFIIISDKNVVDISKMRGMGISKSNITKIYTYQIILIFIKATIFIIPFSYILPYSLIRIVFSKVYLNGGLDFSYINLILVLVVMFIISLITLLVSIKKSYTNEFIDYLRDLA